jgi:hypothetical protein
MSSFHSFSFVPPSHRVSASSSNVLPAPPSSATGVARRVPPHLVHLQPPHHWSLLASCVVPCASPLAEHLTPSNITDNTDWHRSKTPASRRSYLTPEPSPSWAKLFDPATSSTNVASSSSSSSTAATSSDSSVASDYPHSSCDSNDSSGTNMRKRTPPQRRRKGSGSSKKQSTYPSLSEFPPDAFDPSFPDRTPSHASTSPVPQNTSTANASHDGTVSAVPLDAAQSKNQLQPITIESIQHPIGAVSIPSSTCDSTMVASCAPNSASSDADTRQVPAQDVAAPESPSKLLAITRAATALRHEDFLTSYFGVCAPTTELSMLPQHSDNASATQHES